MILTFEDSTVDATVIPLVSLCLTGLVSPSLAQPQPPCDQITASCREAGFLPESVNGGVDLTEDCIRPIMQGTAPRKQATKALPQIDPGVVARCKAELGPSGEESRRDLAQELSVEDRACITAAAAKLPRVAALKIEQSRVVPQPSAQKERNSELYHVKVEIDVSVAGQTSTYVYNCIRDGKFMVIQPLGMR
jgi:hypothetical protein